MIIKDTQFMALTGLQSPFIAADPLYSPLSESSIMTHRVFPGLCGFVPCGELSVAGIFVDKLPDDDALKGMVMLTSRTDASGDTQECWLVQIQSRTNAWQFMTIDEGITQPDSYAVLFQWKPGALEEGYAMHDDMISGLASPEDFWLVGSDLEKQAYSRFVLSTGLSSLAHPYQASGWMDKAIANVGVSLMPSNGPSTSLRAYPIDWYEV